MTAADAFRNAIRGAGMEPPDLIEPGRFHRFAGAAKGSGNTAGWCKLFLDGMGGIFGDYSRATSDTWQAKRERSETFAEREAFHDHVERAKAEAEAKRGEDQAEAAERAAELWERASPATTHPYLTAKGVQPHGVRVADGLLLVPMRDSAGELVNVQRIAANRTKRFLGGARVTYSYHSIGKPNGTICISEGYATGASVHEAMGHAVAVAFNAGNLEPVARELRTKYPDAKLVVCADDDYGTAGNPGLTKATQAARAVGGLLAVPDFGDNRPDGATDFNDLAQHAGAEAVERAIANARAPDVGKDQPSAENATAAHSASAWPASLDVAAYHGIAGEFVRMIGPNTEADPAAILLQFLVAFGALVGRGPHYRIEGDEHHANLYAILVGRTSKARKGTSWGRVRGVFERIADWKPHVSGLSSGEGVKYHVRDAREETKPNKRGELVTEVVDEGVHDKRLLVTESEFASALRAAQRQGNTLSATIREGWDCGNLRTLTKHDPITATSAHICIIGHITADELRAELTATDSANGFANRFLFVAVRRSKMLPHGGDEADAGQAQAFVDRLVKLAATARTRRRIPMTSTARAAWERVYPELSADGDGLHGAVTARAEAQVIRLALVYCLLDDTDRIDVPHLLAALAVWSYCDATARHIFGASLGDRIADEIMRSLRVAGADGLTRTDISDLFKRHQSAERIGAALDLLKRKCRATCESVGTQGRPTEVWRAAS